jgi:hypothetical protein
MEQFGRDRLRAIRVVLPSADDFPDPYSGSQEDARVLLDRVCGYMEVDPATIELGLYSERNAVHDFGVHPGTAGFYQEEEGRFRVWVERASLDDPLGLVATMAHELGHVHLLGHGRISDETDDHEPLTDLLTVFLGMGVIAANATIRETHWNAGAVAGGWSMSRRGYLTMSKYGYALALLARDRGESDPAWAKHLRPDVGAAFRDACIFLAAVAAGDVVPAAVSQNRSPEPAAATGDDAKLLGQDSEPLTADDLLARYAAGERDFGQAALSGAELRGVDLSGADFTEAHFDGADL